MMNGIIKMSAIYLCSLFVFNKIVNDKKSTNIKIIVFMLAIVISILHNLIRAFIPAIIDSFFIMILFGIIQTYFTKNKVNDCIIIFCLSAAIAYIFYYISLLLSGIILKLFIPNITYENHMIFIVTALFQFIFTLLFCRIRRLKNGISFLQDKRHNKYIDFMVVLVNVIIILIYTILGAIYAKNNLSVYSYVFSVLLLVGIIIGVWIQNNIVTNHIQKMDKKYITELENIIIKKEKELEKVKNEAFISARAVHKISRKLEAFELSLTKFNMELGEEIHPLLEKSKTLSKEFLNDIQANLTENPILPLTNIHGIDEMFQYMLQKTKENNIKFHLKIKPSINYMIQNIVNQSKLEMIIGDLITNAIISINANKDTDINRNILVILGQMDGYYSFCIQDSGINFEIETLIHLGLKPSTTHAKEGGSGIGYMTLFEVLNEYKASLIIEEKDIKNKVYTKSITVCFDHKKEYRVKTYRAEEINLYNTDGRILVSTLE